MRGFESGYIPALDGVRGIAILLVLIFHTEVPFLKGGYIGVDIFFVLSGFLITGILIKEFDRKNSVSLKNFYMRRVLRLAPALLILLAVFCLLSVVFFREAQVKSNLIDALIALFYASNWARAF
ncbi:MAG: acyltransferase, partial [Nitrospirae bacterium]|nr:acyltransferase [Nitrospirota bacterium]